MRPALSPSQVPHKIGLYIRVSTEEQASNPEGSIKSQEQRLRAHVDFKNMESHFGGVARVFIDRAKSGKDTNRPELQRLLKAIREREITMIMVSELSRLSRSIKDFSEIWEMMQAHGCEFLSLREQFDTTSAAGEMVIYTIANIAQFERRQISERVLANFNARAQRGLYNGGSVPLGYRLDPEKKGYLLVDNEQAEIVRNVFRFFLEKGTMAEAGKFLNAQKYSIPRKREGSAANPRLGYFTCGNIYKILTNKAYTGYRVYNVKGQQFEVKAVWEPIIDEFTFERAQTLLKKNYRHNKKRMNSRFPFLLSGLVACGTCGDRLPGRSAHGKSMKIPYYAHGWSQRKRAFDPEAKHTCTGPVRVLARIIEPLIWEKVLQILSEPERARWIIAKAQELHGNKDDAQSRQRISQRLQNLDAQLEALAEHLAQIPKGVSPGPIFTQMKKLEEAKQHGQAELETLTREIEDANMPVELSTYEAFVAGLRRGLGEAGEEFKSEIIRRVVQKIEVLPEAVRVHYKVGKSEILPILEADNATSAGEDPLKTQKPQLFLKKRGSTTLQNGVADGD